MREDVWIYDQLNPDERKMRGGKKEPPNHLFLKPIPAELVFKGDERTDEEKEKAQDKYLKSKGIQ